MGLFDLPDENENGDEARDIVEKNRLFETHKGSTKSWTGYLKVLGPITILVLIAIGVVFYLNLPSPGDQVRAPKGLEEAVYDHFLTKEKRTAKTMAFYYCGEAYWVRVETDQRPIDPANPDPARLQTKFRASVVDKGNGDWEISSVSMPPDGDVPCKK